jgi:predicted Zn-dependent protease
VRRDPKLRYGDPFLKAGAAYTAIGKVDEAITCLERFTTMNGSSVEGHVRLARARAAKGDAQGRRRALDEASRTFRSLPGFQRRRQWSWWLRGLAAGFI